MRFTASIDVVDGAHEDGCTLPESAVESGEVDPEARVEMGVVLAVHGAFVGGWYWDKVGEELEKLGHQLTAVEQLPSSGTDPAQFGDFAADIAHVREQLDELEGPVTLIGHSGGGAAITEVADHPAIGHTIYLAALWPHAGESTADLMARLDIAGDWIVMRDDGVAHATDNVELVRQRLFAELSHDEAVEAHSRFVMQSMAPLMTPCQAPARSHPTTFVICELDQVFPPSAQEEEAQRADHVERLPCSHAASVVMPDHVAAIIDQTLRTD